MIVSSLSVAVVTARALIRVHAAVFEEVRDSVGELEGQEPCRGYDSSSGGVSRFLDSGEEDLVEDRFLFRSIYLALEQLLLVGVAVGQRDQIGDQDVDGIGKPVRGYDQR